MPKKNKCLHYWIIESAQQSIASGKCKKCKRSKNFINTYTTELNYSFRLRKRLDGKVRPSRPIGPIV